MSTLDQVFEAMSDDEKAEFAKRTDPMDTVASLAAQAREQDEAAFIAQAESEYNAALEAGLQGVTEKAARKKIVLEVRARFAEKLDAHTLAENERQEAAAGMDDDLDRIIKSLSPEQLGIFQALWKDAKKPEKLARVAGEVKQEFTRNGLTEKYIAEVRREIALGRRWNVRNIRDKYNVMGLDTSKVQVLDGPHV